MAAEALKHMTYAELDRMLSHPGCLKLLLQTLNLHVGCLCLLFSCQPAASLLIKLLGQQLHLGQQGCSTLSLMKIDWMR